MTEQYLYVVFSSTPYRIGKAIRRITGEAYNHVCISLNADLNPMYGFSRRYYHTPFYGGFVQESLSRYHLNGQAANMRVCRLPITSKQYDTLNQHIGQMLKQQERYLYNYLSAVCVPFRKRVNVKDSYICIEFATCILHSIGLDVDPETFYSVGDLEQLLRPYAIYTGPAPQTEVCDAVYYAKKPIPHPVITTLTSFLSLLKRLGQ